jgi:hypothetical protein
MSTVGSGSGIIHSEATTLPSHIFKNIGGKLKNAVDKLQMLKTQAMKAVLRFEVK